MKKYVRIEELGVNTPRRRQRAGALLAGVLAALAVAPSFAASGGAPLASGLNELVAAYENADPRLASHMKLHVTDASGNLLVRVRLAPDTTVESALPAVQAAGVHLTT